MYFSTTYKSPIGELIIVSDGENLCGVFFKNQKNFSQECIDNSQMDDLTIFYKVKHWFDDYFNKLNPKIDFKLKVSGSEFQLQVWKILSQIPYGKTVTYGDIARKISDSMSPQAVGGAVGKNPIAIVIPCHRVVGVNGKLTGYAGGIDKKVQLLKLENVL